VEGRLTALEEAGDRMAQEEVLVAVEEEEDPAIM